MLKITNFWGKIVFLLVVWIKWKWLVCSITLLYSSTFYSLFLPFFVLEIFKFKYDKVFVRHSASISKFEWFEQLCRNHTYILLLFVVHKSKMIITSGVFSIFSKFWFFWLLGRSIGKKRPKMIKSPARHALYLRNRTSYTQIWLVLDWIRGISNLL